MLQPSTLVYDGHNYQLQSDAIIKTMLCIITFHGGYIFFTHAARNLILMKSRVSSNHRGDDCVYMSVCVCVCLRACVCVCVRACVHAEIRFHFSNIVIKARYDYICTGRSLSYRIGGHSGRVD